MDKKGPSFVPKIGKLSPKIEELLLSLVKEEGMQINDGPRKKPGRPAKSKKVSPLAETPIVKNKEYIAKYTKSTLWIIERSYRDHENFLRWEYIGSCTDDAIDYFMKHVGKTCRKRQVMVFGQNYKDVEEYIAKQEQLNIEYNEGTGNTKSPINGGEGKI